MSQGPWEHRKSLPWMWWMLERRAHPRELNKLTTPGSGGEQGAELEEPFRAGTGVPWGPEQGQGGSRRGAGPGPSPCADRD